MIIEYMFDYKENISEVISIGFISFICSMFLIFNILKYFYKKENLKDIYYSNVVGRTYISAIIITLIITFISQIIYYNQEINSENLKNLIILEDDFHKNIESYSKENISKIENVLKEIKQDNKIKTSEYYVLKNIKENIDKENIKIKEIKEYNEIKNIFLNKKNI